MVLEQFRQSDRETARGVLLWINLGADLIEISILLAAKLEFGVDSLTDVEVAVLGSYQTVLGELDILSADQGVDLSEEERVEMTRQMMYGLLFDYIGANASAEIV